MTNSVGPDQTAPIKGAICSGSTLFASTLNSSEILGNFFAADDFSRLHFRMHFFLGALRVIDLYIVLVLINSYLNSQSDGLVTMLCRL